ncbi:MAG TPA: hypothetical protein VIT38_00860 [Allosphingosinicella sp.]
MAEHAARTEKGGYGKAEPARAQDLAHGQTLQRRGQDARLEGYARLLSARPTGPLPSQGPLQLREANGPIQLNKKKSLRKRLREKLQTEGSEKLSKREKALLQRDKTVAPRPMESQLQAEIARRNVRRQAQSSAVAKEVREGDRPDRPPTLKEKGAMPGTDKKVALTAHHLLPYNNIRDSFASAVEKQDLKAMGNILAFSGKASSDSSEAYRALAFQKEFKPKAKDEPKLSKEEGEKRMKLAKAEEQQGVEPYRKNAPPESGKKGLHELFKATTWASHNVFMGPKPEDRADDPKEGLDAQFRKDGSLTKSSVMAKEIHTKGFSGIEPVDFTSSLQSARNEADGVAPIKKSGEPALDGSDDATVFGPRKGGTRRYDASAWSRPIKEGKLAQTGNKVVARRYGKWARKRNWQKLEQLGYVSKPQAAKMKTEVAERRQKKREDYLSGNS